MSNVRVNINWTNNITSPRITSVTGPTSAYYVTGQTLTFTCTFDSAVTVIGAPTIRLTIGSNDRQATYVSGSRTTQLVFRYTIVSADTDLDGITCSRMILLNGGSIRSTKGMPAKITFTPPTLSGVFVNSDVAGPNLLSVTASADTYYFPGKTITLTATFDDTTTVTGTPRIAITIGSNTRYATYTGGSGSSVLTFAYALVSADTDTDGFVVASPIDLNGGTLKDAANNDATPTFTPPSTSSKRAVLRGITYGTDFTQGADSQVLYSVLDGVTVIGTNAVRGSSSASSPDDPDWQSYGAYYSGYYAYFSSIPYATGITDFIDTTSTWSLHQRVYLPTGGGHVVWNSSHNGTIGTAIFLYANKLYAVNAANIGAGAGDGGYRCPCDGLGPAAAAWHTLSLVCSASGAGGLKVYVDGTQTGTITWATTTAQSTATNIWIGLATPYGTGTTVDVRTRAFAVSNVAHTDAEVTDIHNYFASLPNAA